MKLQIVNADPKYSAIKLIEPTTLGYIHIAAQVYPRRLPFLPNGREESMFMTSLKEIAQSLEQLAAVERVTLFDAIAFAPPSAYVRECGDSVQIAQFDIVVLIETTSPESACQVQTTPAYQALVDALKSKATQMHVLVARNAKRIGDIGTTTKGFFLFNYFVADQAQMALELWDYLADWYKVETGLDNSVLLVPLDGERSDYLMINYAHWDGSLPRFLWRQLSKKSFRNYIQANLETNHVGSMPVLYRRT